MDNIFRFFCLRKDCQQKLVKYKSYLVNEATGKERLLTDYQSGLLLQMSHKIFEMDDYVGNIWSIDSAEKLRGELVELLADLSPEYVITGKTSAEIETNPLYANGLCIKE